MAEQTLIERLEKATGPDRKLDAKIYLECEASSHVVEFRNRRTSCTDIEVLADLSITVPAYTGSLDAAMTLVPEGWLMRLWCGGDHALEPAAAVFKQGDGSSLPGIEMRSGKTPAIALCIAALKSRSTQGD